MASFFGQLFYLIISLKQVGPTEIGAILLFGDPIQEVGSPVWSLYSKGNVYSC